MNRTRTTQPQARVPRGPNRPAEWARLMDKLLERCHRLGVRTTAMQAAYQQGKAEEYLRRAGILTLNCIDREYPDLK